MTYIVVACIVVAYIVVVDMVTPCIVMAYIFMAFIADWPEIAGTRNRRFDGTSAPI